MKKMISGHEFKTSSANLLRGVSVEEQTEAMEAFIKEVK